MSSEEKVAAIKEKLKKWSAQKEKDLLRQVVLLKRLTSKENKITTDFTNSVYNNIVSDVDSLRGN